MAMYKNTREMMTPEEEQWYLEGLRQVWDPTPEEIDEIEAAMEKEKPVSVKTEDFPVYNIIDATIETMNQHHKEAAKKMRQDIIKRGLERIHMRICQH